MQKAQRLITQDLTPNHCINLQRKPGIGVCSTFE